MNLLCGPPSNLCVSAFNGHFNAEAAKIRRAPQRKRIKFATFCAKHLLVLDDGRYYLRHQVGYEARHRHRHYVFDGGR